MPLEQFTHADWPGKVHHAEEFASRRRAAEGQSTRCPCPALPVEEMSTAAGRTAKGRGDWLFFTRSSAMVAGG